jgi:hypothetical protein
MKSERISLSAAFQKVKKLRPVTAPNYGFIEKLVGYEKELFGKFCVM